MTGPAPLVVFPDAQAEAAARLRAMLAGRPEPFAAGAHVSTRVPKDQEQTPEHMPRVVCRTDAPLDPTSYNQRTTIRVAVWHLTDDEAHDLAQLCMGLIRQAPGPVLRSVRPLVGVTPSQDPDTGSPLAYFTFRAQLAPL